VALASLACAVLASDAWAWVPVRKHVGIGGAGAGGGLMVKAVMPATRGHDMGNESGFVSYVRLVGAGQHPQALAVLLHANRCFTVWEA
jgi:hypothetical protein